jgi:hypothetical protein
MKDNEPIGVTLSEASTQEAFCQLLEKSERGQIHEGLMLVVDLNRGSQRVLARVSQVAPYNAFYTAGDAWSEARRKNVPIPEEVARQYEIAKLELLTLIPRGVIRTPPAPGEHVYRLDISKDAEAIFGKKKGDSGIAWFGSLSGYADAAVPMDVEFAPMHMAVFGTTGSGKSYDMGVLLERFSRVPSGHGESSFAYPMVVVDAHGDYVPYSDCTADGKKFGEYAWVKRFVFPEALTYNPDLRANRLKNIVCPIGINLDRLSPKEVAETIVLFHKGGLEGADLQVRAIEEGFDQMTSIRAYDSIQAVLQDRGLLATLRNTILQLPPQVVHPASASGAVRALDNFVGVVEGRHRLLSAQSPISNPAQDFVDDLTSSHGLAIVDFSAEGAPGVDLRIKQLVVTYLATLLLNRFTDFKVRGDARYLILVLEEAHNFAPNSSYPISYSLAQRKLSDISTQGRKFGLSLCVISQSPRFVDQIVVSMCNTFLLHKIAHEDVSFVRSVTGGLPPSLINRLTMLDRGELIFAGQMNPVPFPMLVKVTDKRSVAHRAGETRVVDGLSSLGVPRA